MPWLRLLLRVPAIMVLTVVCHLTIAFTRVLRRPAPNLQRRIRNAAFRAWGRGFARIAGMKIRIEGRPPTGTFILVSNHLGYMDIILLATQLDATFVAKSELRSWPVLGGILATADTIFVDRERRRDVLRVMSAIQDAIEERRLGVVLFPEGTSGRGDRILPFRAPLLDFAARQGIAVHHASISYSTPASCGPAQELICWWGDAPFTPHIVNLLRLPRFEAKLAFGSQAVIESDRKLLADKLRQAVEASFTPVE